MNVWQNLGRMRPGSIPTLAEQADDRQVQASQQGDQAAFALLVQRHQRRVFNFALSVLHDNADANDVTQEVFVTAWQGLPSFHSETRFSTWLYRITYTCSVRQLEQRQREQARHSPIQAEPFLEDRNNENWAEEAGERDDVQAVREHVKRLPHIDRIVLLLRHQEQRTYEEMAEILTLPPGTIKTHLFRARKLLKERLLARQDENTQASSE